ncbi:putative hydroxymethylpyrimidine transporter CytX [Agrilactobacillus yilanensis]|uniref:Hydroxymethylpyrimidine transporter CytX n=1 Tax=Agrilactobacillus yilanensis TaxID=2485997 RepID=A0ABW4J4U9_9LACO|nr:putative hydroxymethylpyrimidine transporter CytX [Agrilactobacillus yilanensis]
MKKTSQFLLWLGAAISITEIVTGAMIAPLGLGQGLFAIILGHLIGCFLFLLPAGYIAARQQKTAIESTVGTFGNGGVKLFSLLNGLQLIGWTAVMLVNAALAMSGLSQRLFHIKNMPLMAAIVAGLIIIWLLVKPTTFAKLNNTIVLALIVGVILMIVVMFQTKTITGTTPLGKMSFGTAVELNVTMALSWLPLIGDYTAKTKKPFKWAMLSAGGYFIGSLVMFTIGLLSVLVTGYSDFNTWLAQSSLGLIALLIIVFSTVTTTYLDAYSAAINFKNIWPVKHVKYLAILITMIGFVIAIVLAMSVYENFLYFIGSVFTPLYTIVFVTYWSKNTNTPKVVNFALWLLGILGYYQLQKIDFPGGTTLLLALLLGGITLLLQFISKRVMTLSEK